MSEYKKGDRVKVTYEGTIVAVAPDEIEVDGIYFGLQDENVTIEKLPDPLPTTPGSLIWKPTAPYPYQTYKVLGHDGRWYGLAGTRSADPADPVDHVALVVAEGKS